MIGAISARLVGALVLTGVASQSAEFTQQYLQRLGGAADELAATVESFDESASRGGLDRGSAIDRLRGNVDPFVAAQGDRIGETVERADELQARYDRLLRTTPIFRPFVAFADPDWTIAGRAFDDYRPALPVTTDGFILTFLGFLFGWAVGASGHGAVRMGKRRSRKRPKAALTTPGGRPDGNAIVANGPSAGQAGHSEPKRLPKRLRGESAAKDML